MRCREGDLAYITHPSLLGKFVTVLYLAPDTPTFRLPDGTPNVGRKAPGDWVIESLGTPFDVQRFGIGFGRNRFAVTNDKWLRPIRPPREPEAAPTEAPADVVAWG